MIAFLAIISRIAGEQFWQSLCYCLFQSRRLPAVRDDANQEVRAVLCNSTSDGGAFWQLISIGTRGRGRAWTAKVQLSMLVLAAAINVIAFGAAGIVSSRVTSARSEVLLRPSHCGGWRSVNASTSYREWADMGAAHDMWVVRGWHFHSMCRNSSTTSTNCNAYGRRLIHWTSLMHNECPFDPSMCTNDTVVRLDSGMIDSHLDLGINSRPSDRITVSKVTDCAPLTVNGFTKRLTRINVTDVATAQSKMPEGSPDDDSSTGYYYAKSLAMDMEPTFVYNKPAVDTFIPSSASTPYPLV